MTLRFPPEESGTAFLRLGGVDLIRHYGDPEAEYAAASERIAIRDRSHRAQWRFTGRQPLEMLQGIVTGCSPESPAPTELGVLAGAATYHTVLTPKGRMLADLHLWLEPTGNGEVVRAHLPVQAAGPLKKHLAKVLPPRLARLEDESGRMGMISILGPGAARLASGVGLGLRVEARELEEMRENDLRLLPSFDGDQLLVMRNGTLAVPAFDVVGDRAVLRPLWSLLAGAGAEPVGLETWDTLRVERGRPAFGTELGPDVIPVEAGIHVRAIDYEKGCYTGQEVIVRIRDRGHVNRHLRRLVLDINAPVPTAGSDLFRDDDKSVGSITTAVDSPRRGKMALAYLRREVQPGHTVHVGSPDGPRARVEALPED